MWKYKASDWSLLTLCLLFHYEHFLYRFKKYKQAGSHSNSFRLSNGRTEDVGKAPLHDMGNLCGEENQEIKGFPIIQGIGEDLKKADLVLGGLVHEVESPVWSPEHLTNLPACILQNPRACHFWPGPQAPTGSIHPCPWTSWKRRLTGEWLMTISSSERNST